MRKIVLVLAVLFCADLAYDSFDADCFAQNPAQPCSVCLCQTPRLSPASSRSEKVQTSRPILILTDREIIADLLTDKSFFQPPKALA